MLHQLICHGKAITDKLEKRKCATPTKNYNSDTQNKIKIMVTAAD